GIADAGGLDRDQRLDLVRPRLRDLEAKGAGLAVEQDNAGTDPVDLRNIGRDDRIIGGGPARNVLLDEILVSFVWKLAARHQLSLRWIRIVGARASADAKSLERVARGQKYRLALED